MRRISRRAADKMVEQRHAYGEAVGHLFKHSALRTIGHDGINFETANHRAGMQHERVRPREPQAFVRELVAKNIFRAGKRRFMQAFRLNAQDDDDVRSVEPFFDIARHGAHLARAFRVQEAPTSPDRRA